MRKFVFLIIVLSLLVTPAFAQFQQLVEIKVRPGHERTFENYLKKIIEAADKVDSPVQWSTFSVAMGKDSPTYRVALPFSDWGERDGWPAAGPALLVQAFGEEEAARIDREGRAGTESVSIRVWELLEEGTSNPQTTGEVAKYYDVQIRHVKPEMLDEFRGLHRRFTSAYESASSKPSVTRWVLRIGEGTGNTFRRTQPFDTWAEYGAWNPLELIRNQFGDDTPLLLGRLNRAVWKTERFVSAHRPELSRAAGSSTSNE